MKQKVSFIRCYIYEKVSNLLSYIFLLFFSVLTNFITERI